MQSRLIKCLVLSVVPAIAGPVSAEGSLDKATEAAKKTVSRSAHKAKHRVEEAVCTGSAVECAAQKAQHRVEETGEDLKDKGDLLKDAVK